MKQEAQAQVATALQKAKDLEETAKVKVSERASEWVGVGTVHMCRNKVSGREVIHSRVSCDTKVFDVMLFFCGI